MKILADNECFPLKDNAFDEFRTYWEAHGKHLTTVYATSTDGGPIFKQEEKEEADEVSDTVPDETWLRLTRSATAPMDCYRLPLDDLDSEEDRTRRINLERGGHYGSNMKTRVGEAVKRITSSRNPYNWFKNSCSLDTWLLEELALVSLLCSQDGGALFVRMTADRDKPSARLLKVLLAAGTTEQDLLRTAYWLMEIEEWDHPDPMFKYCIYNNHEYTLNTQSKARDTRVGVKIQPVCTNEDHICAPITRYFPTVKVKEEWFSRPDEFIRYHNTETKKWEAVPTNGGTRRHANMADLLQTVVARSESESMDCAYCRGTYFIGSKKTPEECRLPKTIRFEADPETTLCPEEEMHIGGWIYDLFAVVFSNGGHFIGNFLLEGKWYSYDDMGFVGSSKREVSYLLHMIQHKKSRAHYIDISTRSVYAWWTPPNRGHGSTRRKRDSTHLTTGYDCVRTFVPKLICGRMHACTGAGTCGGTKTCTTPGTQGSPRTELSSVRYPRSMQCNGRSLLTTTTHHYHYRHRRPHLPRRRHRHHRHHRRHRLLHNSCRNGYLRSLSQIHLKHTPLLYLSHTV